MTVSVVIVTYFRPKLVDKLTSQIKKYNPDSEIVVIDQSNKKPNLCAGRNEGLKKASREIVIYFDDDVEITKDTINFHIREYQDPKVVGVAGRVINDGEVVPKETEVVVGRANKLLTKFDKNFWSTKRQFVQYPYGCNMSFLKSVLIKAGGFDEKIPSPATAFDEIDMALRIEKLGEILFSPKAIVYHHRALSGGTRENNNLRKKQYYQSYGRLIRKHVGFPLSVISLIILKLRIIKEAPETLFSFLKGYFFL